MSAETFGVAMEATGLTPVEKFVLVCLSEVADYAGHVVLDALDEVRVCTGASDSEFKAALDGLQAKGWVIPGAKDYEDAPALHVPRFDMEQVEKELMAQHRASRAAG